MSDCGFLALTDYHTGLPVYVHRWNVRLVRQLPAGVYAAEGGGPAREYGGRTKVETDKDSFIVCETANKIMALIRGDGVVTNPTEPSRE